MAEIKGQAEKAFGRFIRDFEAKYPKATASLTKDREALLAFYIFPAEHWVHIRTTNPVESSFATIRHRTTRTKNCVSRNTLLGLVFQLALTAEKNWRRVRGFKKLPGMWSRAFAFRMKSKLILITIKPKKNYSRGLPDSRRAYTKFDVRRAKALSFSGCKSRPATFAPAGSNWSSRGGNEAAEASNVEGP